MGFIAGTPTAMCGGLMIKSGVKGLKKLFFPKKKHHVDEY
jgi:hypothetical protein